MASTIFFWAGFILFVASIIVFSHKAQPAGEPQKPAPPNPQDETMSPKLLTLNLKKVTNEMSRLREDLKKLDECQNIVDKKYIQGVSEMQAYLRQVEMNVGHLGQKIKTAEQIAHSAKMDVMKKLAHETAKRLVIEVYDGGKLQKPKLSVEDKVIKNIKNKLREFEQ